MASQIDIYNMALSRVHVTQRVMDPAEKTEPNRVCNTWYAQCRDECLRTFPWAFARKAKALALSAGQTTPGWEYAYDYPNDCMLGVAVMPEQGVRQKLNWLDIWNNRDFVSAPRVPWDRMLRADGQAQIIVTDLANAYLLYVGRISNTQVFDADFVNMLAWRLAADIAGPLKARAELGQQAWNNFEAMRGRATATDFNESYSDPEPDAPSIQARC